MKESLSQKSWKFGRGHFFTKCPKLAREAPRAIQKIKKKLGSKGPWAQIWAHGPYSPWALLLARVHASSPALLARVHASSASLAVY